MRNFKIGPAHRSGMIYQAFDTKAKKQALSKFGSKNDGFSINETSKEENQRKFWCTHFNVKMVETESHEFDYRIKTNSGGVSLQMTRKQKEQHDEMQYSEFL